MAAKVHRRKTCCRPRRRHPVSPPDVFGLFGGTAVVFMRVDGGGHTWPGAPAILQAVGPASHGFDASEASWQFFDAHAR